MPFYSAKDMKKTTDADIPYTDIQAAAGEFVKVGVVTKRESEGGSLHAHSDEEQWSYILEGRMHYILGDEEKILGPGDLVHIPRFVKHRSRAVGGPVTFFTVKSPVHAGGLRDDMTRIGGEEAAAAERRYDEMVKNEG
jgi:quercetin dioxygenase-like cupin family protein